jgi:murein DD-endopeptidase MepM/ murein hydrolase activator NlpD
MKTTPITLTESLIERHQTSLKTLFPTLDFESVVAPDMNEGSDFFAVDSNHDDLYEAEERLRVFQLNHANALLANGYLEKRSFYNTPAFSRVNNGKVEFRNIHLGTDFWVAAGTAVHSPLDGEVVISHNNSEHKDYGPTIVLKHNLEGESLYTLYGHLSVDSLVISPVGRRLKKGEEIGAVGNETVNGHWVPHLHFQLITDLLDCSTNYNGVAFESELDKWKVLCPDPDLLFTENLPRTNPGGQAGV